MSVWFWKQPRSPSLLICQVTTVTCKKRIRCISNCGCLSLGCWHCSPVFNTHLKIFFLNYSFKVSSFVYVCNVTGTSFFPGNVQLSHLYFEYFKYFIWIFYIYSSQIMVDLNIIVIHDTLTDFVASESQLFTPRPLRILLLYLTKHTPNSPFSFSLFTGLWLSCCSVSKNFLFGNCVELLTARTHPGPSVVS